MKTQLQAKMHRMEQCNDNETHRTIDIKYIQEGKDRVQRTKLVAD